MKEKNSIQRFFAKAFNTAVLEKSRMPWVDYLRGITIMLVAYRHVLLGIQRSGVYVPNILANANMVFYSFRMPLFFVLSGVFISGSLKKRTVGQFVTDKFEGLLYPYFIWAFIQITLQIVLGKYTNSTRTVHDYLYIFYQPANLDQFWYLPALFNSTVVYVLIKTKLKPKWWAQVIIALCFYFASPHLQFSSMISDWMEFYIFFAIGDLISGLFFHENTQKFFRNPYSLILLIPVFAGTQFYYLTHATDNDPILRGHLEYIIIALTGCLCMIVLAYRFQAWKFFPFLRVLGYHSLFIYVMHVMVAAFVRAVCTKILGIHNAEILLVTGIFFGVTIPVMIYNLFIKDNFGWFLFNFRRKKKNIEKEKPLKPAVAAS